MKILICGDNHWSQYSSIVRQRGEKYSLRLENQIKSINWVEALAVEQECACIIHLGDFFDAPNLCSEEITALKEIEWAEYMPHYFLVGNHEIGTRNLQFNSVNVLTNNTPYEVIDKITNKYWEDIEAVFIPYMFEGDKPELSTLFKTNATKKIIFSHNDIKGIQMGQFISKEGHFGKLGGFHLDQRRLDQLCQTTGDLCLTHAGGALHNDVFGSDLLPRLIVQTTATITVAQSDGYALFRLRLPDDILIQFRNDLTRGIQFHHSTSTVKFSLVKTQSSDAIFIALLAISSAPMPGMS